MKQFKYRNHNRLTKILLVIGNLFWRRVLIPLLKENPSRHFGRGWGEAIFGSLTLFALSGCVKNALDVTPVGLYTPANYWRNESDVIAGVNGIYNVLTQEEGVGHNLYAFDDAADDISVDGDHPDFWEIERFTATPNTYQLHPTWGWAYEQIARANNAILYIPKVPVG